MHIIYNVLLLLAAYRWGDWRNGEKYYPTILFIILCDFLHNFLSYDHQLWTFHEKMLQGLLPNHTIISLLIMFVGYPSTILIYLYKFFKTNSWWKRTAHFLFWVILYLSIEFIGFRTGYITYHNGWEFWHSIPFVFAMFIIIPLHHKNPRLAWGLAIGITTLILHYYGFSIDKMK
ncbi:CBO0543 family protein [Ammoniphilus sp. YIM 78166]|uniref:CBO0543 family protein n=1 Tax=Ammoniphilus sp. YIM 78166 TaxID=1644106 RepID=UPI00106F1C87|nr:CBO0543 family protein [Ammoniphilus sp. YIM 78166]